MDTPSDPIPALLATQIEAIWSRGQVDLIDTLYAETVVDHMPVPGQAPGRAGLRAVVETFRAALPDLAMTLHGTIACGDIGVDWWTLTGTHRGPLLGAAPTGRPLAFGGIDWVRVEGGRIAEVWHIEEMFQMAEQLGICLDANPAPPALATPATASMPDPAGLGATETRNLAIARRHIEGLWAAGDTAVAHEVYTDDVVDMNPMPGQHPGIPGILDVLAWLRQSAPDLAMHIDAYAASGDHAADRWTMVGTHTGADLLGKPARGRRFVMQGMDVVHITGAGRIDRVWHVEDLASLRTQL